MEITLGPPSTISPTTGTPCPSPEKKIEEQKQKRSVIETELKRLICYEGMRFSVLQHHLKPEQLGKIMIISQPVTRKVSVYCFKVSDRKQQVSFQLWCGLIHSRKLCSTYLLACFSATVGWGKNWGKKRKLGKKKREYKNWYTTQLNCSPPDNGELFVISCSRHHAQTNQLNTILLSLHYLHCYLNGSLLLCLWCFNCSLVPYRKSSVRWHVPMLSPKTEVWIWCLYHEAEMAGRWKRRQLSIPLLSLPHCDLQA